MSEEEDKQNSMTEASPHVDPDGMDHDQVNMLLRNSSLAKSMSVNEDSQSPCTSAHSSTSNLLVLSATF